MMQSTSTSKALPSVVGDGHSSGLGFGCMGITAFYGDPLPDDETLVLLKEVYDAGCRHFDTAEIYKTGNAFAHDNEDDKYNETILGKFFQTVPRDSYTVATKFMPSTHGGKCDYDTVKEALTNSLERLGLEYADIYYCLRITGLDGACDFGRAAKRLKEEGLIRAVGLSEISGPWLRKVHEECCPIDAVQQEWSLATRNLEEDLVPACRELGITVVAYSPLCRNLLASKLEAPPSDWRGSQPRFSGENFEKNMAISDIVGEIAKKNSCTSAQLALGWLFKKAQQLGVVVIPIPGTRKVEHALSNCGATKVDITDDADMKALEELAEKVAGERGDEHYIAMGIESQK